MLDQVVSPLEREHFSCASLTEWHRKQHSGDYSPDSQTFVLAGVCTTRSCKNPVVLHKTSKFKGDVASLQAAFLG